MVKTFEQFLTSKGIDPKEGYDGLLSDVWNAATETAAENALLLNTRADKTPFVESIDSFGYDDTSSGGRITIDKQSILNGKVK